MGITSEQQKEISVLYDKYNDFITGMCRKYMSNNYLEGTELEDLTQSCWEKITHYYDKFDASKYPVKQWLSLLTKGTLYNILKAQYRQKRSIHCNTVTINEEDPTHNLEK